MTIFNFSFLHLQILVFQAFIRRILAIIRYDLPVETANEVKFFHHLKA